MSQRFVKVVGLHNIFNTSGITLDITSIKSSISNKIDGDSVVFITADLHDVQYGYREGSQYIWTHGELYATNDVLAGKNISIGDDNTLSALGYVWDASQKSFAEGYDSSATGLYSHAEGYHTEASGEASHAEGAKYENNRTTESFGKASHAEGASTYAKADGSHAEGVLTTAGRLLTEVAAAAQQLGITGTQIELVTKLAGYGSHAEGTNNNALGSASHAEGNATNALANATHAEGDTTTAFGEASHAEGYNTLAKGNQSHAEGQDTVADGNSSHAEGWGSTALGSFSHAEGSHTESEGRDSHAEGAYSKASGIAAHAEGSNVKALNESEHAEGTYNLPISGVSRHTVGIGTGESNRKNAHLITTDGKHYIPNVGSYDGTQTTFANVQDVATVINSKQSAGNYATVQDGATLGNVSGKLIVKDGTTDNNQIKTLDNGTNGQVLAMTSGSPAWSAITGGNGSANGTIQLKIGNVSTADIAVKGLGSAAFTDVDTSIDTLTPSTTNLPTSKAVTDYIEIIEEVIATNHTKLANAVGVNPDYSVTPWSAASGIPADASTIKLGVESAASKMVEITWSDLKTKRDSSALIPGMQYRITDYVTATVQSDTLSAGHVFDVIVVADSTNTLNENARAIQHTGDTYFANSKLKAWELKYCLENDTARFAWADATNGKGVIWYMKDEKENECYYDFKNIRFKVGQNSISGTVAGRFYYTFSKVSGSNDSTIEDLSKVGTSCYKNSIGACINSSKYQLYYNVFRNTSDIECEYNKIRDNCRYNAFNSGCNSNSFIDSCNSNSFGKGCSSNIFDNSCSNNSFGDYCFANTFNSGCSNNKFGTSCIHNIFGSFTNNNTLGNYCSNNTFGNECDYNSFGTYGSYNTLGDNCDYIIFGTSQYSTKNYYRHIIIENGNKNIYLNCTATTSSSSYYQNIKITLGVNNTTTWKTINDANVGQIYQTVYQPVNTQVISI